MKNIILGLLSLFGILATSCSSNDEHVSFAVSIDSIEFESEGGESSIAVTSSTVWAFNCPEEWVTIRKNKEGLRVIVDENLGSTERTASIILIVENSTRTTISITQKPLVPFDGLGTISADYESRKYRLKHNFKGTPSVEANDDWCSAVCIADSIIVNINKNFNLQERQSKIILNYNNYITEIPIIQSKCPWYDSFQMLYIEGGTFYMGAQSSDTAKKNYDKNAHSIESPVHKVTLNSFYLCAYEVTQEQWTEAMGENPSISQFGGKYPVENISWEDAQLFINKLCSASGKKYRLPTEAEWEYASKGGKNMDSYLFSGGNVPSTLGWFYSNSNSVIHEVGQKFPNTLGIHDMTGNVSEWVLDWFSNYEDIEAYNPSGPEYGTLKINRGGSCNTSSLNCRNSYRNVSDKSDKNGEIGLRIVLEE